MSIIAFVGVYAERTVGFTVERAHLPLPRGADLVGRRRLRVRRDPGPAGSAADDPGLAPALDRHLRRDLPDLDQARLLGDRGHRRPRHRLAAVGLAGARRHVRPGRQERRVLRPLGALSARPPTPSVRRSSDWSPSATGSQRVAILCTGVFFVLGLLGMFLVDERRGRGGRGRLERARLTVPASSAGPPASAEPLQRPRGGRSGDRPALPPDPGGLLSPHRGRRGEPGAARRRPGAPRAARRRRQSRQRPGRSDVPPRAAPAAGAHARQEHAVEDPGPGADLRSRRSHPGLPPPGRGRRHREEPRDLRALPRGARPRRHPRDLPGGREPRRAAAAAAEDRRGADPARGRAPVRPPGQPHPAGGAPVRGARDASARARSSSSARRSIRPRRSSSRRATRRPRCAC